MSLTKDIRDAIISDLAELRAGRITVAQAKARAALARNILDSYKIDIIAQRLTAGDLGREELPQLTMSA